MTKNEAIEKLKNMRLYMQITDKNNDCKFTEDDYKANEMAIQALEKRIPKKPRKTDSYRGVLKKVYAYVCPTCGNARLEKYMNERQNTVFCWDCGQKLDWSDEE